MRTHPTQSDPHSSTIPLLGHAQPVFGHAVLLYDGLCPLCHGCGRVLRHNVRRALLRFASLQDPLAQRILVRHGIDTHAPNPAVSVQSVVLIQSMNTPRESLYLRSDAILQSLRLLGDGWERCAQLLQWIPRPLRDGLYRCVARARRSLFGTYTVCPAPPPSYTDRFLHE